MYVVTVHCKKAVKRLSDPEDREYKPQGKYRYLVNARSEKGAIERALDLFHDTIPIGCLDDFDIDSTAEKYKPSGRDHVWESK